MAKSYYNPKVEALAVARYNALDKVGPIDPIGPLFFNLSFFLLFVFP